MADYALLIGVAAGLTAAGLLAWRALRGSTRRPGCRALGVALALLLALAITAAGAYGLMRSRSFQLAGELIRRVDTEQKVVALTLDDGPTAEYTPWVLSLLKQRGVRATFYLSGGESEQQPAQLRAIVAAGHELGNHTYDGRRLVFQSSAAVADTIARTDAVFRAAGYTAPTTVRPPGCKKLLAAPLYFSRSRRTTVTWDLEPDSLGEIAGDVDAMVRYVAGGVQPGSIVLLHVMYASRAASREALPRIIDRLAADGYRFVTVSELLALGEED